MLKVAVSGAQGRVGQCLVSLLEKDPTIEIIALIVREIKARKEITLAGLEKIAQNTIDCVIDFSRPSVTLEILKFCLKNQTPLVIGTTGFTDQEKESIKKAADNIPIILAPNMSMGINLLYKLSELLGLVLKNSAETAIVDIHHKHKKDSPSGTALKLKETIESATHAQSTNPKQTHIASLRLGSSLGEHKVWFSLDDEEVVLSHKTLDRAVYAKGALLAAKWLVQQNSQLYDMQDVLGLNWIMNKESHV